MKTKTETISQDLSFIKNTSISTTEELHKEGGRASGTKHPPQAPFEVATLDVLHNPKKKNKISDVHSKTKSCVSDTESTMDRELENELSGLANIQEHASVNSWLPTSVSVLDDIHNARPITPSNDQTIRHQVSNFGSDIYIASNNEGNVENRTTVEIDPWLASSILEGTCDSTAPVIGKLTHHEMRIFESKMSDTSFVKKDDESSKQSSGSTKSAISLLSREDIKKIKKQKNKK